MREESPEQKAFYLALGRFVHQFAAVEAQARLLYLKVLHHEVQDEPKNLERIPFATVVSLLIKYFKDNYDARELTQLSSITFLRNDILHNYAYGENGERFVIPNTPHPLAGQKIACSPEILEAATYDLLTIYGHLAVKFHKITENERLKSPEMDEIMNFYSKFLLFGWKYNR